MELFEAKIFQFGEAQSGRVSQFQDGLVAQGLGRIRLLRLQQFFDLGIGEGFGEPLPSARQGKIFGDVGRQEFFVFGKAIKSAQGGDFQVDTFTAQAARGIFRLIIEGTLAFVLEKRHEVLEFDVFPIGKVLLCGPGDEFIEQGGVGPLRVLRLPAFVAQVFEKIFNECLHGQEWEVIGEALPHWG